MIPYQAQKQSMQFQERLSAEVRRALGDAQVEVMGLRLALADAEEENARLTAVVAALQPATPEKPDQPDGHSKDAG